MYFSQLRPVRSARGTVEPGALRAAAGRGAPHGPARATGPAGSPSTTSPGYALRAGLPHDGGGGGPRDAAAAPRRGVVVLPFQHHPIPVVDGGDGRLPERRRLELGSDAAASRAGPGLRGEARGEPGALRPVAQAWSGRPWPSSNGLSYSTRAVPGTPREHLAEAGAEPDPRAGGVDQRGVVRPVPGRSAGPILTFPANQKPEALRSQIDTYRRVYREHGHDPPGCASASRCSATSTESAAEANETFERGMEKYFGFLDSITVDAEKQQHSLYDRIPTLARLRGLPKTPSSVSAS